MPKKSSLIAEIGRRVANWGYWLASGGSPTGMSLGFELFSSNEVREGNHIPILYGEAEETDKVMKTMNSAEWTVLVMQHISQPPIDQRYRSMGLKRDTYYRLVAAAHQKFSRELKKLRVKSARPR